MAFIEVNQVCKTIHGTEVLKEISLSLEKGKIYGFVGKNGSGKTMLFRVICGLIHPTEGTVRINGKTIGKDMAFAPDTGLVIENIGLWKHLSAFDNLKMLSIAGTKPVSDQRIRETIARFGLDPDSKKTFGKFSLGMKQRLCLAQAFLEEPSLLVLDEPTNGIDEEGVTDILHEICAEKEKGHTVLLASHDRETVNAICDQVFTLSDGRLKEV